MKRRILIILCLLSFALFPLFADKNEGLVIVEEEEQVAIQKAPPGSPILPQLTAPVGALTIPFAAMLIAYGVAATGRKKEE